MKKTLIALIAVCIMPCAAMAQSEYIQKAMEKKFGAAGLAKLNEWVDDQVLNVKMEDTYTFPYAMNMHIITYKKGVKKDEADIRYFFNPDKQYFASEASDQKKKQETLIIYDYQENALLMLQQKEKTGLAFNINAFMSSEAIANREREMQTAAEQTSVSCKKTGEKKHIQGYPCEAYICSDEEKNTRTEVWITDRIPVNIVASKVPGTITHLFGGAQNLEGLLMAGNFYRNDQLESSVEITSVNDKADLSVTTADYTFSNR